MDLIMERTRGMTLSDREKADLRTEDFSRKAKGFCLKLLDDPGRSDEILSPLDQEPTEDRNMMLTLIWRHMVEDLPTDKQVFSYIDLLEKLPQSGSLAKDLKELRAALNAALKAGSAARHKALTRERKKLESAGISGSAVIPKLPGNSAADADFPAIVARFRDRLLTAQP